MPLPNTGMSFTPFDPLPASDLNDLVENIDALSAGTAIDNLAWSTTALSNPYKFSVYRNAAMNTVTSTPTVLPFDTELYDTNNNMDVATNKGRYTAPVSGFYFFAGSYSVNVTANSNLNVLEIHKNGTLVDRGAQIVNNANVNTLGVTYTGILQLTASDYVELYTVNDGTYSLNVGGVGSVHPWFSGYLFCRT